MTSTRRWTSILVVLASLGPAAAGAQTIGYTVGVAGVQGTYPGERLDSVYLFQTLDASRGPVRASLSVPWFRLTSTPDGGEPVRQSGLGDPFLRADVRVARRRGGRLQVSLAGAVKPPLVDVDSGRGTGELDVAAGVNVLAAGREASLIADVLYWKYGDPDGVDFRDTVAYSVGAARSFGGGRWSALSTLSGGTARIGDLAPPLSVTLGVLSLVGRRQSVVVSASAGLTDGASDFAIGASWRVSR